MATDHTLNQSLSELDPQVSAAVDAERGVVIAMLAAGMCSRSKIAKRTRVNPGPRNCTAS